jgi:uncharacterized protein
MNVEKFELGTPCWVALTAEDLSAAAAFYGALFGWQLPAGATAATPAVFRLRDLPVAGLEPTRDSGRGRWLTYVHVADADATLAKVTRAGGRVLGAPADAGAAGRFATFTDPFGAPLAVWQPKERPGAGVVREPGAYAWSELITDDVQAAAAFYGAVFDWKLTTPAAADPLQRREWQIGARSVAGLLPRPPAMPKEIPPYWDVYFGVADTATAAATITRLGGTMLMPPTDIGHGHIAVFTDPAGAVFTVMAAATGQPR